MKLEGGAGGVAYDRDEVGLQGPNINQRDRESLARLSRCPTAGRWVWDGGGGGARTAQGRKDGMSQSAV